MFVCSKCNNPEHVQKDQTEADNNTNVMINKSKKQSLKKYPRTPPPLNKFYLIKVNHIKLFLVTTKKYLRRYWMRH